ncbi:hypothetical protein RB195_019965 [Necator americanus]|uniref:Uncharacterized protein n=2 Tax=Necator americanus TaxID=51031 RepID=A0ABR1CK50_NECAM
MRTGLFSKHHRLEIETVGDSRSIGAQRLSLKQSKSSTKMSDSNEGIFHSMGNKAQELSNATQEKIGNAGHAVKETVQSGYDKVTQAGKDAYDAVANKLDHGKCATEEKTDEARDYMAKKMKEGADVVQAH